jgi:hypothetical protein
MKNYGGKEISLQAYLKPSGGEWFASDISDIMKRETGPSVH